MSAGGWDVVTWEALGRPKCSRVGPAPQAWPQEGSGKAVLQGRPVRDMWHPRRTTEPEGPWDWSGRLVVARPKLVPWCLSNMPAIHWPSPYGSICTNSFGSFHSAPWSSLLFLVSLYSCAHRSAAGWAKFRCIAHAPTPNHPSLTQGALLATLCLHSLLLAISGCSE